MLQQQHHLLLAHAKFIQMCHYILGTFSTYQVKLAATAQKASSRPVASITTLASRWALKKTRNTNTNFFNAWNNIHSTSWPIIKHIFKNNADFRRLVCVIKITTLIPSRKLPGKHLRVVSLCGTGLCCRINTLLPLCFYLCPLSDKVGKHQATIHHRFLGQLSIRGTGMRHTWL